MAEQYTIHFGILGCANIARKVSRAIRHAPNCTISAIGSRSIEKASQFAKENEYPASVKVSEATTKSWMIQMWMLCMSPFPQAFMLSGLFWQLGGGDFLKNDIRVQPDLDALGSLGDAGWYCIRAILWANDYEMPKTVTAWREPEYNEAGVIPSCGASLRWEDGRQASFYCSFLANSTMDISALETKGNLRVHDFVIPFQENVGPFYVTANSGWVGICNGCDPPPSEHLIKTELPQEALMVKEFSELVENIKEMVVRLR